MLFNMTNPAKTLAARLVHFVGWFLLTDAYMATLSYEQLRATAGLNQGPGAGLRTFVATLAFLAFGILSAYLGADIARLYGLWAAFAWCLVTVVALVATASAVFARLLPDDIHPSDRE